MSELTLAVLVCNVDGRIPVQRRRQGRRRRERARGGAGGTWPVDLRDPRPERRRPRDRADSLGLEGERRGVGRAPDGCGGPRSAPARRGGPGLGSRRRAHGLVLTLENVTRRAEIGGRRDAVLRSLSEGTRASGRRSVPRWRACSTTRAWRTRSDSGSTIIRDEAVALSALVEDALRESAGYLSSEWPLEDTLGRDLVAAVQRKLESELDADVDVAGAETTCGCGSTASRRAGRRPPGAQASRGDRGERPLARAARRRTVRPAGPGLGRAAGQRGDPARVGRAAAGRGGPRIDAEGRGRAARRRALEPARGRRGERASGCCCRWPRRRTPSAALEARSPAPERPRERPELYDFDLFRAPAPEAGWDERRLDELAYTVLDTETTGLDPATDEIISIGAVRALGGRLLRRETFDRLVDPRRPLSAASVAVHGISPDLLEGEPTIDEVLPPRTLRRGHRAGRAQRRLRHALLERKAERTGVRPTQPVLDTLLLSAVLHPDEEDHSLEAMADRLGVSVTGRHTALGDAILTCEIFLKQIAAPVRAGDRHARGCA